jgi:hypothetical protein
MQIMMTFLITQTDIPWLLRFSQQDCWPEFSNLVFMSTSGFNVDHVFICSQCGNEIWKGAGRRVLDGSSYLMACHWIIDPGGWFSLSPAVLFCVCLKSFLFECNEHNSCSEIFRSLFCAQEAEILLCSARAHTFDIVQNVSDLLVSSGTK